MDSPRPSLPQDSPSPAPCHHHHSSPRATSSSPFIRHNGAEFFETYDYGKSDGRSQTHGNSERQHVPDFSVTEQLEMNKNTLFTQFFFLSELLQHATYIFIQNMLVHIPLYRKYIIRSN